MHAMLHNTPLLTHFGYLVESTLNPVGSPDCLNISSTFRSILLIKSWFKSSTEMMVSTRGKMESDKSVLNSV